ncbi:MAG TPA: hypothetical protein VIL20_22025, partial [Sandaracinaceae bacterium]
RCTGVAWETTIGSIVLFDVLWRMGRWNELFERYPASLGDAASRGDLLLEIYLRVKFRALAHLAADRPEDAAKEGRDALARWTQKHYTLLHLWQLFGAVEALMYAGRAHEAREHLDREWATLVRSQLLRVQVYAVTMHDLRGRVALACAARSGGRARIRSLREAEREARTIGRMYAPWSRGLASALLAGVAAARRDATTAIRLFARAERELRASHMSLHAQVARARRAALKGDRATVDEVSSWIRALGVARAEPWLDLLAPGRYGL